MKTPSSPCAQSPQALPRARQRTRVVLGMTGAVVVLSMAAVLRGADQIEMQNGDRYAGTVLSMDPTNVVLRSKVLGKVTLPRSEVANITFGTAGRSNAVVSRLAASTNGLSRSSARGGVKSKSELADLLRQINGDTNSSSEVQQQILGGAGPEANQKYRQMLQDLSSGKMSDHRPARPGQGGRRPGPQPARRRQRGVGSFAGQLPERAG